MQRQTKQPRGHRARRTRRRRAAWNGLAVVGLLGAAFAAADRATATGATTVDTSLPAQPAHIEELDAALVSAEDIGLPVDWVIRDLDPHVTVDDTTLVDLDPFLGLLSCPAGTIRGGPDDAWLSRTFSTPDVPLENGMLSAEIVVELKSADDFAADRAALDDCEPIDFAELRVGEFELTAPDPGSLPAAPIVTADESATSVEAMAIELRASPTAEVPYPSAYNAVIANADDRSVTVIVGGIDTGVSWQPIAEDIAWLVLESLRT